MKKLLAMLLTLMMVVSIPVTCLAASDSVKKSNTEFGTMTGSISSSMSAGRKEVNYSTKTTKTASRLIVFIDVNIYSTGKKIIDGKKDGEIQDLPNKKEVGYYWECHTPSYNKQKLSSFGTHEARGKTSLVGYTGIKNF